MNWKLPNQLTIGRMLLAGLFFLLLGLYDQNAWYGKWLLDVAFGVYIVAGITDVLDGWIARKYNLTSAFGRIVDPFVDKVLVVGAFVMLTGGNFMMTGGESTRYDATLPAWLTGHMASAVQAWMVVVILAREFVVSAIRGYSESCGIKFPATSAGKFKMLVQSIAICTILFQLSNLPNQHWAVITKVVAVWAATITTVLSGLAYVGKARGLLKSNEQP